MAGFKIELIPGAQEEGCSPSSVFAYLLEDICWGLGVETWACD
jgi:hypothetical protein